MPKGNEPHRARSLGAAISAANPAASMTRVRQNCRCSLQSQVLRHWEVNRRHWVLPKRCLNSLGRRLNKR